MRAFYTKQQRPIISGHAIVAFGQGGRLKTPQHSTTLAQHNTISLSQHLGACFYRLLTVSSQPDAAGWGKRS